MLPRKHVLACLLLLSISLFLLISPSYAQSDSDSDGVQDSADRCPSQPGSPDTLGCPDTDKDGLGDPDDQCPTTPGSIDNNGCPAQSDGDGDGVPDGSDQCPNLRGVPENAGCPGDADKDGVYDENDLCPFVSGQGDQFGGANGADGCPVDSDGDRTVDGLDRCPFQAGPPESGGCPAQGQPTATPTSTPGGAARATNTPGAPQSNRPSLPSTGPCVLATAEDNSINVRERPETDAPIARQISPSQIVNVLAKTTVGGTVWYQVERGWVASFVTRLGGDCRQLAEVAAPSGGGSNTTTNNNNNPPPADPEDGPRLAANELPLAEALANCPSLQRDVAQLHYLLQMDIITGALGDPCTAGQELLGQLLFGEGLDEGEIPLDEANLNTILDQCPAILPALVQVMNTYQGLNANGWVALNQVMTPSNACQLAQAIAAGEIPPEFAAALANLAGTPVPHKVRGLARFGPLLVGELANDALLDLRIAICMPTFGPANPALGVLRDHLKRIGLTVEEALSGCFAPVVLRSYGKFNIAQEALLSYWVNTCGWGIRDAYTVMGGVIFRNVNIAVLMSLPQAVICGEWPAGQLEALAPNPLTDPDLPPTMQACPDVAYALKNVAEGLSLIEVYSLLFTDPIDPCTFAINYIKNAEGNASFALAFAFGVTPSCYDLATDTITLSDGTVLTQDSPWAQKVAVLTGQDFNAMCAFNPATLPPANSDGDLLLDDADVCPFEFGTGPDGCPGAGSPPPLPPAAPPLAPSSGSLPPAPSPTPSPAPGTAGTSGSDTTAGTSTSGAGGGTTAPNPWISQPPLSPQAMQEIALQFEFDPNSLPNPTGKPLALNAVFQAKPQGGTTSVYLLEGGQAGPLYPPSPDNDYYPALNPSGELVAFISQGADGSLALRLFNMERGVSLPLFGGNGEYRLALYPMQWSGDGNFIFMTLTDATGKTGIYQLLVGQTGLTRIDLIVDEAQNAVVAPNGRYIAFERPNPQTGNISIWVSIIGSGTFQPITEPVQGLDCTAPSFGANSLDVFFSCDSGAGATLYEYSVAGLLQIPSGIANATNPQAGPSELLIGFDDGQVIYYGYDDGSKVVPMIQVPGLEASHIQWAGLQQ